MADGIADYFDRLGTLAASEPPAGLIERARAEAPGAREWRRTRVHRRLAVAAVALTVLLGASLTPPGRAATGWIAELAGSGEPPTLEQKSSVKGSAVVLDSGVLSDGTAYELVAKRITDESLWPAGGGPPVPEEPRPGGPLAGPGALCLQVDFPGVHAGGQGGHCTEGEESGEGIGPESGTLYQRPESRRGSIDHDGPGLFVGIVEPSETDDVRVYELRPDGSRVELASELIPIEGEVLERIGINRPKSVVVAELDGETVAAGNRGELEVRAIAFGPDGAEIGHEDVDFYPASCPDHPRRPTRLAPAGRSPDPGHPAPFDPSQFDQPFTDVCPPFLQTAGPPKLTVHELRDAPVPHELAEAARESSHPLRPATAADYKLVHTPGADLQDVDTATQHVARPVTQRLGGATIGGSKIYLARLAEGDTLVYVVQFHVRAVHSGEGWEKLPEERSFFGIVEAVTGEAIVVAQVNGQI